MNEVPREAEFNMSQLEADVILKAILANWCSFPRLSFN